jgi:hypothetical protein
LEIVSRIIDSGDDGLKIPSARSEQQLAQTLLQHVVPPHLPCRTKRSPNVALVSIFRAVEAETCRSLPAVGGGW